MSKRTLTTGDCLNILGTKVKPEILKLQEEKDEDKLVMMHYRLKRIQSNLEEDLKQTIPIKTREEYSLVLDYVKHLLSLIKIVFPS